MDKNNFVSALIVFLALLPAVVSAQNSPMQTGRILLDGEAGLRSTGNTIRGERQDDRSNSVFLNGSGLYFVLPGLGVGTNFHVTNFGSGDFGSTAFGLGPAVRYYFTKEERSFHPFVGGSVSRAWNYRRGGSIDGSSTQWGYFLAGGVLTMLNTNVGLSTSIYYNRLFTEQSAFDTIGLAVGLSTFIR